MSALEHTLFTSATLPLLATITSSLPSASTTTGCQAAAAPSTLAAVQQILSILTSGQGITTGLGVATCFGLASMKAKSDANMLPVIESQYAVASVDLNRLLDDAEHVHVVTDIETLTELRASLDERIKNFKNETEKLSFIANLKTGWSWNLSGGSTKRDLLETSVKHFRGEVTRTTNRLGEIKATLRLPTVPPLALSAAPSPSRPPIPSRTGSPDEESLYFTLVPLQELSWSSRLSDGADPGV